MVAQIITLPVNALLLQQKIIKSKLDADDAKEFFEKMGLATGIAIAKEYLSKKSTLEELCQIWRTHGFSELNFKKEEDVISVTANNLFNEEYPERPFAKGILEGLFIGTYGGYWYAQKILENKEKVTFSVEQKYSFDLSQPSSSDKKIDLKNLKVCLNKINITSNDRLEKIVNKLLESSEYRVVIITPTHPKILAEKYKEKLDKFAQIIMVNETEKKQDILTIPPSRIDHELYALPRNFFIEEKIKNKNSVPVLVLTHLEPFSTSLGEGWENKVLNYLTKLQNLCAEYDGIGILGHEAKSFSESFTARLYRLLNY
ncbi:MAG: hypothetical protein QW625_00940 [Candidatus Nanoarchaeia archaeon]